MRVLVTQVSIPAMSTVGIGRGTDPDGNEVAFGGDHRPMRAIGEALAESDEPIEVWVDDWQLVSSFDETVKEVQRDVRQGY